MDALGQGRRKVINSMMKDNGIRVRTDCLNLSQNEIAVQRLARIGKPRRNVYNNHGRSFLLKMEIDERFSFNRMRSSLVMRKSCRTAFVRIMKQIKV